MVTESSGQAVKLKNLKPYPKGKSGNPGGKAKGFAEFKELCRLNSWLAMDMLMAAALKGDVQAMKFVVEMSWGKPVQQQDVSLSTGGGILIHLPAEEKS